MASESFLFFTFFVVLGMIGVQSPLEDQTTERKNA